MSRDSSVHVIGRSLSREICFEYLDNVVEDYESVAILAGYIPGQADIQICAGISAADQAPGSVPAPRL